MLAKLKAKKKNSYLMQKGGHRKLVKRGTRTSEKEKEIKSWKKTRGPKEFQPCTERDNLKNRKCSRRALKGGRRKGEKSEVHGVRATGA